MEDFRYSVTTLLSLPFFLSFFLSFSFFFFLSLSLSLSLSLCLSLSLFFSVAVCAGGDERPEGGNGMPTVG